MLFALDFPSMNTVGRLLMASGCGGLCVFLLDQGMDNMPLPYLASATDFCQT